VTDGFQTGAWLSENACEVAIVELKMSKVDGISLISFIREMNPTLPVVVFTGVGYDEEQMHVALHAGANGYVGKNLPIEQLYCVLARVLATASNASAPLRSTANTRHSPAQLSQVFLISSNRRRNSSGEMQAAPHALTVSFSRESEVATVISKRDAYLAVSRSTIESADCPLGAYRTCTSC
jgi:DNA-binding NarL/FixJ family response regulator